MTVVFPLGVQMRKSVINLAVAAAALLGAASAAQAKVVLTVQAYDSSAALLSSLSCDSSAFGACASGFILLPTGLVFVGSVSNFSVSTTSFTGNMPGTALSATLNASTTSVSNNSVSGFGYLYIDVYATDYLFPAGNDKYLSGSASITQAGSSVTAGDYLQSNFYADGTNNGLATNMRTCTVASSTNGSCAAPAAGTWNDANGGFFSMRDIQTFRLSGGSTINSTASGEVTPVPEPMTLSLVGAALLAAGAAARRKAKKA
jgi:hypothetical protein